jgi:leucine dehydrogenase
LLVLVLDDIPVDGYERVVHLTDPEFGVNGFIAVHSTAPGPSLGGLRIRDYASEENALQDVLSLAEAMTFKAAAAGLPFGGGKAVLIGDPKTIKSRDLLEQYGRAVDRLGGAYVTAEDVGTTVRDLAVVAETTRWVAGLPEELGGSGDPSPATAQGVVMAMRAFARYRDKPDGLRGMRVMVQGLGKVGSALVELLVSEQAEVLVADVDKSVVNSALGRYRGLHAVAADTCMNQSVDILAPCALGGVLNENTVPLLRCQAIVGSANNQLESPGVAQLLTKAGIIYVPDFIANAGGIINIASEFGYSEADTAKAIAGIADTTTEILQTVERANTTTYEAAMELARSRLANGATAD